MKMFPDSPELRTTEAHREYAAEIANGTINRATITVIHRKAVMALTQCRHLGKNAEEITKGWALVACHAAIALAAERGTYGESDAYRNVLRYAYEIAFEHTVPIPF